MVRAASLFALLTLNMVLWGTLICLGGIVKFLSFGEARRRTILAQAWLAEQWVHGNDQIFGWTLSTRWDIQGLDGLTRDGCYLVVANHNSWIDIFALFRAFHGRAPFIRFFLKRMLIWVPILGQATWALDFPFMRRYSARYLAQHPEKRGKDLETTRNACLRYKRIPVTLLNFLEGTRFTREKQEDQRSPYRHLLRPRIGGVGFVLASMGDQLDAMIDVTLVYTGPEDASMIDFVMNRVESVIVRGTKYAIPAEFRTAAVTEPGPARDRLKSWIEGIWKEKDALIESIRVEERREA